MLPDRSRRPSRIASAVMLVAASAAAQTPRGAEGLRLFEPDAQLLRVAERLPRFGGIAAGKDGLLTVSLVQAAPTPGAAYRALQRDIRSRLADVYGADLLAAFPEELRIQRADFRLVDLARWRVAMDRTLEIPGVVHTDLDEGRNRVAIGVESAEARAKVLAEARRLGIPSEALLVEIVVPDGSQASLKSKRRPLLGGIQIEADVGVFADKICTLGFNAIRDGAKGFVTNSHCTKKQGGDEGTDMHQPDDPLFSEGNHVGDESFDPPYQEAAFGPCPAGERCRTSDSAFVRYRKDDFFGDALVARTDAEGSLTIADDSSDFIGSVNRFPLQGFVLDKIGRTTGWTSGSVTQTCAHARDKKSDVFNLCSYRVSQDDATDGPLSLNGDSGSPVFRRISGTINVELDGILWGGPIDDSGSSFVFSSILFVELELAPIQFVDFPRPPPAPTPPIGCEVNEKCCERDADNNCLLCIPRMAACP